MTEKTNVHLHIQESMEQRTNRSKRKLSRN